MSDEWRSLDDLPDVEKTYEFTDRLFEIIYGKALPAFELVYRRVQ